MLLFENLISAIYLVSICLLLNNFTFTPYEKTDWIITKVSFVIPFHHIRMVMDTLEPGDFVFE